MQFQKPIFEQISTLKNLPSLPHILLKLLEACNQDTGSLDKISEIVHKDPSLSAKILRLVNSAYFGLPQRVEDVRQAVVLIGMNGVKNVAVCACVYEAFHKTRGNADRMIFLSSSILPGATDSVSISMPMRKRA